MTTSPAVPKTKPENLFLNLILNIAVPTAIQTWGSGDRWFGPNWGLVMSLLFPLGYGLYDFATRRRFNFISAVGFGSILITGGLGLMSLDSFWFAVKDGAIPALIAVAVLASMRSKAPLVEEMLYNPQVIDTGRVEAALAERGNRDEFTRLMHGSSYLLATAFAISAVLNFVLARWIITAPPNTTERVQQIAKMHWVSLGGAVVPAMAIMMYALWRLFQGIGRLTGLTIDEILHQPAGQKNAAPAEPGAADKPTDGTP